MNVAKTVFPHRWFSKLIFLTNFVKFPPFSAFESGLTIDEYKNLKAKYCNKEGIFSIHEMLIDYCQMDVLVLKMGFSKYCQAIWECFLIHPLNGTITLSSLSFKIFKSHYLPSNVYALDSIDLLANNSKLQFEVLYYIKTLLDGTKFELITQREKLSQVNINVQGKNYSVDVLLVKDKTVIAVIEVNGCAVHEHLIKPNEPCYLNNTGSSVKHWQTKNRLRKIAKEYDVVNIYECEWYKIKRRHAEVKAISSEFRYHLDAGMINLRSSLAGGRSEVMVRFKEIKKGQKLVYVDVNSLYPHMMRFYNFASGWFYCLYGRWLPKISDFIEIMKKNPNFGIAMVTLNPPNQQYIPVLGVKISGIYTFCLCTKCAETLTYPCTHSKKDRQITATYTYPELLEAINSGYELVRLHEIIFCEETSKIFEAALKSLQRLKWLIQAGLKT